MPNNIALTNDQYMQYLLKYYKLLTNGRVKPDKKGGVVRESIEQLDDMARVKKRLSEIFKLNEEVVFIKHDNNLQIKK